MTVPIFGDIIEEKKIVKPVYTFLPGQKIKSLRDLKVNSMYFVLINNDWVFTVFETLQNHHKLEGYIYNFRILHMLDHEGNIPYIKFRRGELQPELIKEIYLKVSEAVY